MAESTPHEPAVDEEMKENFRLKRKEFRDYLEATGTMDALTRGLVALYENPVKPPNPLPFFMDHLSLGVSMKAEIDTLKRELTQTREKLSEAVAENLELRSALASRRSTGSSGQGFEEPEDKGQSPLGLLTTPAPPHH